LAFLPKIPQLLLKPETQNLGKQIAGGLVQRVAARLIREVLLQETPQGVTQNGHKPSSARQLALPPISR
jgi:hypothetical protein